MQILLAKKTKTSQQVTTLVHFFYSLATDLARKWILQD
jgi:hypothetical protein